MYGSNENAIPVTGVEKKKNGVTRIELQVGKKSDNVLKSHKETVRTWDYAKDHLFLCIQKKSNENIIKRDFLDLEIYVRVRCTSTGSYKVVPGSFDVDEDTIFRMALNNNRRDYTVHNDNLIGLTCISNQSYQYGAAAMCDKNLLKSFSKKYNSDLVIMPSSIHDCIIAPDNDPDMDYYNSLVCMANEDVVDLEDQLANHVYFYKKDTNEIIC